MSIGRRRRAARGEGRTSCRAERDGDVTMPGMAHAADAAHDEARLLEGLRAGRHDTFEQIVRLHGTRLLGVARRILRDDDLAREAVQDALVSAFRARTKFAGTSKLSTWLHRITVNAALM